MKITFAGVVIALERQDGGFDAVTGFKPRMVPVVQSQERLRAKFRKAKSRGNRAVTISGVIWLGQADSLEEAMLLRAQILNDLPDEGILQLQTGSTILTFPEAALGPCDPVENADGVAVAYAVSFEAGESSGTTNPISNEAGGIITGEDGVPISDG